MSADSKASPHVNGAAFDPKQALDPARALVPSVVQVNEQRVAKGFGPKIRRTAAKIPFAGDALSVWFCAKDPATPRTAKAMMMAGLAYFVMPADAIPDVLAIVGFTDDAAVFALLMGLVGKNLKPRHRDAAQDLLDQMKRDDD
ncbi:YkvA family protein [Phenylobacterium sp.]|uniref:YkvA family protein n=1 Tax=Phenylobacterium sp. TaxID=1871053 RepID=UPI00286AA2E3|nr:YkvA family protein [Phenylobacterium sp.]